MAASVIAELEPLRQSQQVNIRFVPAQLPPIPADPKLLRIIFQNLLSNAYKYSRPGSEVQLDVKGQNLYQAVSGR